MKRSDIWITLILTVLLAGVADLAWELLNDG